MPGERGLAGARKPEQPEDRWRAAAPRPGLEPFGDGLERDVLLRLKGGHGISKTKDGLKRHASLDAQQRYPSNPGGGSIDGYRKRRFKEALFAPPILRRFAHNR